MAKTIVSMQRSQAGADPAPLERSEEAKTALLRAAVESFDEFFLLCDQSDRIVLFNHRFAEIVAGTAAPGQTFESLLRELARRGFYGAAIGRAEAWISERLQVRRTGDSSIEIKVGLRWYLVRDRRAADGFTITVGTDITARKEAEEILARSEARFRSVFEQAAVGMAVRSLDGRWLQVNRKLCEILGFSREELLRTTSVALTAPEERGHADAYNERIRRGEIDAYSREKRYLRKDGSTVWVELSLTVVRDREGNPDYVSSVIVDISARKAAQEQAHAAEERLRTGLENLGEMVVLTDAEDRIVIANSRFLDFNSPVAEYARPGCHYSDHLRAGIALGLFPDASGCEAEWLGERMAVRHARVGPVERRRQDGRWLLVDDQPLPDGGIVSFGIEITATKLAEEAAAEANQRLSLALEFSRVTMWDIDIASGAVFLSEGWSEFIGTPRAVTATTVAEQAARVHPDDLPHAMRASVDALKGRAPEFVAELRIRTESGAWRWILARGRVAARDAAGRALRTIGTTIDITERKTAEQSLVASEARFRSLVGLSNDVFWESDAQHRFVLQEYSPDAAVRPPQVAEVGKTRWELPYTRPGEDAWRRHREDLDAHRVFRDFELARPLPGGGERFVQASGEPVFDATGRFTGYRGVGKDITARRLAEDALRAANANLEQRVAERTAALETAYRELEAFSYSVSHDLRAPLRAIAGFATILREDEGDKLSAEGVRLLEVIDQSAQQMGRLTDALLELARTSRKKLDYGPVDMGAIATEVARAFDTDYPAARVEIGVMPIASGDATLLRQVFVNLIGNALKYSSHAAAPRVDIGAEAAADGGVVYVVRDNGIGFEMAYVDRLFRPFERLHAERDFRGAGIGLALVNLIIQRHGGRIWAEGQTGNGAVFRFTLGG